MSTKIKFAVIGCGHIGKRHATMIQQNAETQLVALCDIKEKDVLGLESFDTPFFNDMDTLLVPTLILMLFVSQHRTDCMKRNLSKRSTQASTLSLKNPCL